jgi:hypothetical protein
MKKCSAASKSGCSFLHRSHSKNIDHLAFRQGSWVGKKPVDDYLGSVMALQHLYKKSQCRRFVALFPDMAHENPLMRETRWRRISEATIRRNRFHQN